MIVERLIVGPLQANCWIVGAEPQGPVVVIDPGDDAEQILSAVGARAIEIIVLTHSHFDHVGAVSRVRADAGCPVLIHESETQWLASPGPEGTGGAVFGFDGCVPEGADGSLEGGDRIEAAGLTFEVLHTPGHSPGSISLLVADPEGGSPHLFSGDTLFAGSVGRTDFPGGQSQEITRSIATKFAPLPAVTMVHPGHGPDTTIGREARINPFWPRG